MDETLLVVLGAILAIAGGFLHQMYQNCLTNKRKDRELLHQGEDTLIEMLPLLGDTQPPPGQVDEPCKKLLSIANRIWVKDNLDLAERMVEFARKDGEKTKENAVKLITDIATKIGKALDRFHKKQNELFRRAAEELRQMRGQSEQERD
jgi:hypothetical protein